LTDAGSFQRRPGFTRVGTDENCRGLTAHGECAYYVAGNEIKRLDLSGASGAIGTVASQYAPISCVHTPRGVVLSDTFSLQLLNDVATPMVPQPPAVQPLVSIVAGTLMAGDYSLFFVAQDA